MSFFRHHTPPFLSQRFSLAWNLTVEARLVGQRRPRDPSISVSPRWGLEVHTMPAFNKTVSLLYVPVGRHVYSMSGGARGGQGHDPVELVTGSCRPPDPGAGAKLRPSTAAVHILNHSAVSQVTMPSFFFLNFHFFMSTVFM